MFVIALIIGNLIVCSMLAGPLGFVLGLFLGPLGFIISLIIYLVK